MEVLVQLPEEFKMVILAIVTMAVTEVLKFIGSKFKFDLSGYAAQISSAVVASIVVAINAQLAGIPAEYANFANIVFQVLVVLLTSWGGYKFVKQLQAKG